jgi:hypothetical protein
MRKIIIYINRKIIIHSLFLLIIACSNKPTEKSLDETKQKKYTPKYITEYIDSMKQYKSFEKHRFFYDENENAIVEILMINTKDERKKRTIKKTWIGGGGEIGNGEIKYTLTKKQRDEIEQRMEQRRENIIFTEIEKIILQTTAEYRYDWEKAYGIIIKYKNPNIKKGICNDYANAVLKAFENNPLIDKAEKWTSETGKHAWNVIILKDGKKLYTDATWYQGNGIDNEGYIIDIPRKNPVNLTFDLDEFNSLGGAIDGATGELLKVHFAWGDAKLAE